MFHGVLSDSELLLMKYLWDEAENGKGGVVFSEIMEYSQTYIKRHWKKQTINTFLSRLRAKDFVISTPTATKAIYTPNVSRADYFRAIAEKIYPDANLDFPDCLMDAMTGHRELTKEEKEEILKYIEEL